MKTIGRVSITAGTKDRMNRASMLLAGATNKISDPRYFEIEVEKTRGISASQDPHVTVSINYDAQVTGEFGTHKTKRRGTAKLPLNLLIEMTTLGLLKSEYCLSHAEYKRLLLAIAGSLEGATQEVEEKQ